MSDHVYYIMLDGVRYQVRREGEKRQVFVVDTWLSHTGFVDWLHATGEWGALCELAALGLRIIKGEEYRS